MRKLCIIAIKFCAFVLVFLAVWSICAAIGGGGLLPLLAAAAALIGSNWALGLWWALETAETMEEKEKSPEDRAER